MSSTKKVHNTHISEQVRVLHGTLLDIVAAMNQPQRDEDMVREAGIALDRALFPLLVGIERLGPIGIVDLAERMGRDYSTISRQVAKLESLGLAERRQNSSDRRVNEAVVTPKGKAMTDRIDEARDRMAGEVFANWEEQEVKDLVRLMRKFADALMGERG
ncbi:MAG: MarR family transcriptional regulator [Paracoccus sp. BP8]|uniref:Transcriptional regulator MarR family n=1 Tax=Paracoccus kondratievae TaxID=135740 RepID=A0A0G3B6K9_9RHOB|nr:MarR family winged helix-turn-helix transcriptional regulator [Paracoccus kondratievae]AKJ20472.1 transcriptional regulator MarR family [Paracoccus kondratievae]RQP05474.1 MAG: MarR family transcriptional regulator [Paracoccus sp. BP8]